MLGLFVTTYVNSVATHQEMKLEDELKDLIERDLEPVVTSSRQEALLEDRIEICIVKRDKLLKVVDMGELLL